MARIVAALVVVTNAAYCLSVLFLPRTRDGYSTLWEGWVYTTASCLPAVLAGIRGVVDRRATAATWLVAAGVLLNCAGNTVYTYYDQNLDPVPFPAWSDAPWLASYGMLAAGLIVVAQRNTGQQHRAVRLDGLVIGLAAGAVAVALWFDAILAQTGGLASVIVGLAYPIFDLVFVVVIVAGLAPIGFRPDWSSGALMAGAALFALGDVVYLRQVAADTYRPATVLELTWVAGMVLYGFAPWLPTSRPERDDLGDGVATVVPAVAAVVALAIVAVGVSGRVPDLATWLAITAIAAVLVRARVTIRALRSANEGFRQARTDDLTGLLNRRGFGEEADRRLAAGVPPPALMMIDLNGFKEVNDSLGHASGDHLLVVVAARLARALPPGTVVARLGGDEFGVVAPSDRETLEATVQAIQSCLAAPIRLDSTRVRVTASVGVAAAPDDGGTRDELIRAADVAMYEAKRNQLPVAWYSPERDPHTRDRLALIEELRSAIEQRAFTMHFQPSFSLRTGAVVGMEALIRWNHPVRGMVPPDEFIPLAERVGLIPAITRAALELSIHQLAVLLAEGHSLGLSVNISALDLVDDDLPVYIADTLAAAGVPPQRLTLEITETALCGDPARAEHTLGALRAGGMRISIDDFGVGYASLSQLLRLPLDELKIDRSFVTAVDRDRKAQAVLAATVELGRTLALEVVAEGVETPEELAEVARRGADVAQGYLLSRPLPGDQLARFLASRTLAPTNSETS
ncbi:MAG: EAL domain-containing protein [Acidimicrobiales bacterium]